MKSCFGNSGGCAAVLFLVYYSSSVLAFDSEGLERFQKTGKCIACDLSGVDFHGQGLSKAMLQRGNLTGTNLSLQS